MPKSVLLKEWLISQEEDAASIYLLDGGVSTHLRDLTNEDFKIPQLWSSSLLLTSEGKEIIVKGHKDWLASGTNILTTVTYQCHNLTNVVDEAQMKQMLKDGVQLARRAIREYQQHDKEDRFVVGSIGCYGGALADGSEYTGIYPAIKAEQDLVDFHRLKTLTLVQESPDGIALETVPCVMECRAFVSLLKELKQYHKLPACWISLACRNGEELNDGSKIEDALAAISESDPDATLVQAIGINCCDSGHVQSLAKRIISSMAKQGQPRRAVVIFPNSGEVWDAENKAWKEGTGLRKDELQDVFAGRLMDTVNVLDKTWKKIQPQMPLPRIVLGGCCRTRPQTIAALRRQVDQWQRNVKPPARQTNASSIDEQQRIMAQILARDADFDHQIGEIGEGLQDMLEIQQRHAEETKHQSGMMKKH